MYKKYYRFTKIKNWNYKKEKKKKEEERKKGGKKVHRTAKAQCRGRGL